MLFEERLRSCAIKNYMIGVIFINLSSPCAFGGVFEYRHFSGEMKSVRLVGFDRGMMMRDSYDPTLHVVGERSVYNPDRTNVEIGRASCRERV